MDDGTKKEKTHSRSSNQSPGGQRLNPITNKGLFCSTRVSLKGGEVIVSTDNDYSQELFMKQLTKRSHSRSDKHRKSSKKVSESRSNHSGSDKIVFNDYTTKYLGAKSKRSMSLTKEIAKVQTQESKVNLQQPVIESRLNKMSETQMDNSSCNTKVTSRFKPIGNYNTGPLYMGNEPPKFQPIVMKRSFHIKQTHDMLELQRKKRELEFELTKNHLEAARQLKKSLMNHDIIPHGRINFQQIRQQMVMNAMAQNVYQTNMELQRQLRQHNLLVNPKAMNLRSSNQT